MSTSIGDLIARSASVWSRVLDGDLDALDEIYAVDVQSRGRRVGELDDLAGIRRFFANSIQAFSAQTITFDRWVVQGDVAAIEWTWRARHTGQSPDLPFVPSGRAVTSRGCTIVRFANGKVVEESQYSNDLHLLRQIGAMP